MTNSIPPSLCLVGETDARIYGLTAREWQVRNWTRAGADKVSGKIVAATGWVLSSGLAAAVVQTPGSALVEPTATGQRLVAAHLPEGGDSAAAEALIAAETADDDAIRAIGLAPSSATDLAGSYNKELRKREAPFAVDIKAKGILAAEKALFKSSYKGITDLVTKYAWPWPAFHVTRFCAAWRISPNTVTTISLLFVFAAMWFFWQGQWALGFITGWLMTFLDTVDGKLARTTLTSSSWGNIYDHGIDLIHPPFWYWAWYVGIFATVPDAPGWMDAAFIIILAGYVLGRVIEGIFIAAHGFHIHVWGPSDSFVRVITARRNPNMLIFMVLCILGDPALGFGLVAVWTILTVGFHAVRLVQAGFTPATPPLTSWITR
ncbi:MAG: CDP-alcohol phosphatidyltransferase family protein [Pseudomonadota bacterium]